TSHLAELLARLEHLLDGLELALERVVDGNDRERNVEILCGSFGGGACLRRGVTRRHEERAQDLASLCLLSIRAEGTEAARDPPTCNVQAQQAVAAAGESDAERERVEKLLAELFARRRLRARARQKEALVCRNRVGERCTRRSCRRAH